MYLSESSEGLGKLADQRAFTPPTASHHTQRSLAALVPLLQVHTSCPPSTLM